MTILVKNIPSLFLSCLFILFVVLDLGLTQYGIEEGIAVELNPLINTEDFSANYLAQAIWCAVLSIAVFWSVNIQAKKYIETGKLVKNRFRKRAGDRTMDVSGFVLLLCLISILLRGLVVLSNTLAVFFQTSLVPSWGLAGWEYSGAFDAQTIGMMMKYYLFVTVVLIAFSWPVILMSNKVVVATARLSKAKPS